MGAGAPLQEAGDQPVATGGQADARAGDKGVHVLSPRDHERVAAAAQGRAAGLRLSEAAGKGAGTRFPPCVYVRSPSCLCLFFTAPARLTGLLLSRPSVMCAGNLLCRLHQTPNNRQGAVMAGSLDGQDAPLLHPLQHIVSLRGQGRGSQASTWANKLQGMLQGQDGGS